MLVLVVGGTGGLGRLVVRELGIRGHQVRVLSRQVRPETSFEPGVETARGDVATGQGLAEAVTGVQVVVDTVNAGRNADQVMVAGTQQLVRAAANAGVQHVIGIGIVGAEAIAPLVPYYRAKVAQEQVLSSGDVPWSWLRATQFHDFVAQAVANLARLPVLPAPSILYQPVDRGEVAAALADAVEAGPAGRVPDFAGPQTLPLVDLARIWLQARGRHQRAVTIPIPTRFGRRLREGALCNPDRAVGRTTFQEWVNRQVRDGSHA
ncbi:MAG TPA: NAD(P)H-binding protein [Propionibacteriaceae bacterium]